MSKGQAVTDRVRVSSPLRAMPACISTLRPASIPAICAFRSISISRALRALPTPLFARYSVISALSCASTAMMSRPSLAGGVSSSPFGTRALSFP